MKKIIKEYTRKYVVWMNVVLFFLFLFTCCQSAKKENKVNVEDAKDKLIELTGNYPIKYLNGKRLIRFEDLFPKELDFHDSLLYIIMAKSDISIHIYDRNSGELKAEIGNVGQGPQDILSPQFLTNNYELKLKNRGLTYYDLNSKCTFYTNATNQIVPWKSFVEGMYPVRNLSISENYWVGQKIQRNEEKMFQIYDVSDKKMKYVDYYPKVSDLEKENIDKNYWYALNLGCHPAKNRIIAGMYFFDLIQVYNLEGDRLSCMSLDENYEHQKGISRILNHSYSAGYSRVYSTDSYCYLRRGIVGQNSANSTSSQIIRLDWNGKINAVFQIKEPITGGFCVDEDSGLIYCSVQFIDPVTDEEYYDIMSYELPL